MECVRCHGLVVVDCFVDLEGSSEAEFTGWRCVACGDISDPVIIANRHTHPGALTRCDAGAAASPSRWSDRKKKKKGGPDLGGVLQGGVDDLPQLVQHHRLADHS